MSAFMEFIRDTGMLITVMVLAGIIMAAPFAQAGETTTMPNIQVIPQPTLIRYTGDSFTPANAKTITAPDTAQDLYAARLLRDAIREILGVECGITIAPFVEGSIRTLSLSDKETGQANAPLPADMKPEGYILHTGATDSYISANDSAGLFYGVQTLIQLIGQSARDGGTIPGIEIEDSPTFGLRGLYIEGGQSKGSTIVSRDNIERVIRRMSEYKMNHLIIEMYNLAPFQSFPYSADSDTLTLADWNYLVELAHAHHIIITPSLQSFSQMFEVIWTSEEGKPYREGVAEWPGMICPSRPENINLLKGLYKDLLTIFKYTPYLGVGCSEVGMSWKEHCPLCRQRFDAGESLTEVYIKHVRSCLEAVKSAGKELGRDIRPWMWADEFYMAYPHNDLRLWQGIDAIPRDTVMGHWAYWSRIWMDPAVGTIGDYQGVQGLLDRGFDVMFVSASYLFNTYLLDLSPDEPGESSMNYTDATKKFYLTLDSGVRNITDQARWADSYAQNTPSNKVLGGVCATFSQHDIRCWDTTWYAYALQADYTWGDPARPLDERKASFTRDFAASFYGARDMASVDTIARAYNELDAVKSDIERNNYIIRDIIGEYDIQDSAYADNTLEKSLALISGLMDTPDASAEILTGVRARAENTRTVAGAIKNDLAALSPRVRDTRSLAYLITAAGKIENHAIRTIYLLDHACSVKGEAVEGLPTRLAALINDTKLIASEADELAWGRGATATPWTPTGDATGYHKMITMLEALAK